LIFYDEKDETYEGGGLAILCGLCTLILLFVSRFINKDAKVDTKAVGMKISLVNVGKKHLQEDRQSVSGRYDQCLYDRTDQLRQYLHLYLTISHTP